MSNQFVAEIRVFPFNFPPKGFAFCNGQLIPISQNTALFSLLGTFYGGDGRSTFGLPNIQGNIPISQGQGPGLSLYDIGQSGGTANVTLNQQEIPKHQHLLLGELKAPDKGSPSAATFASGAAVTMYSSAVTPLVLMDPAHALGVTGSSLPHNNMMPYLTLNFCIALQGIFPPRS